MSTQNHPPETTNRPRTTQTSIRIDTDLLEEVKADADKEGRSFNNKLNRILLEYRAMKDSEARRLSETGGK